MLINFVPFYVTASHMASVKANLCVLATTPTGVLTAGTAVSTGNKTHEGGQGGQHEGWTRWPT